MTKIELKNRIKVFPKYLPFVVVIISWLVYMLIHSEWHILAENWHMALTMVFGSVIAGASAEGGGAVAFPVMTLLMKIPPEIARNFSLAIQSVGMTMASYLILINRIKIEVKYLIPVSAGGAIGMALGTYYLVPIIPAPYAKMLFVTFWLSFGLVLFYTNEIYKRNTIDALPPFSPFEKGTIFVIGILGGSISAMLGSGLDIFSFSYVTMRYHLSEKVATPTSVIIMAGNSLIGFFLHSFLVQDFGVQEFNYWLVCIPVVTIGAPLGAYFISTRTRNFISRFLYLVILVQFIGALFIIRPSGMLLIFSIAAFLFGIFFFFGFSWLSTRFKLLR